MDISKREKYILIAAIVAIAFLFGDRYILTPILKSKAEFSQELKDAQNTLSQRQQLLRRSGAIEGEFERLRSFGLTEDIQELESSVLRYIRNSSQECNVRLSSLQPDLAPTRIEMDGIGKMDFALSASGQMGAISHFLWKIETSNLPLLIVNMQLGSSDEIASNMNLQLRLSSVYLLNQKEGDNEKR